MRRVYLDWNATTPPLETVVDAMREAARQSWGNPSSVHAFGREALARVVRRWPLSSSATRVTSC